jgi:hypothetical protein
MQQATQLRERIPESLDSRFTTAGFRRPKRSFEWKRKPSRDVRLNVHLNFGVYATSVSVNPNMGARHASVEQVLEECAVCSTGADAGTFGRMLSELSDGRYESHLADGPESVANLIWADWCAVGRQFAEDVGDQNFAIRSLTSDEPDRWCCDGRDFRAMLLRRPWRRRGVILRRSRELIASAPCALL